MKFQKKREVSLAIISKSSSLSNKVQPSSFFKKKKKRKCSHHFQVKARINQS